jgi:hypothetical protein
MFENKKWQRKNDKDIAWIRSPLDTTMEKGCNDVKKKESVPIDGKK